MKDDIKFVGTLFLVGLFILDSYRISRLYDGLEYKFL